VLTAPIGSRPDRVIRATNVSVRTVSACTSMSGMVHLLWNEEVQTAQL